MYVNFPVMSSLPVLMCFAKFLKPPVATTKKPHPELYDPVGQNVILILLRQSLI